MIDYLFLVEDALALVDFINSYIDQCEDLNDVPKFLFGFRSYLKYLIDKYFENEKSEDPDIIVKG